MARDLVTDTPTASQFKLRCEFADFQPKRSSADTTMRETGTLTSGVDVVPAVGKLNGRAEPSEFHGSRVVLAGQ